MSFKTLYSLASLYPGPSPRLFSLSLPDTIGWFVGTIPRIAIWSYGKFTSTDMTLSDESIENVKKTTDYVKSWCTDLQLMKIGEHEWTKEEDWYAEPLKSVSSLAPVVALEKAARVAAVKVQSFVTRKPSGLRDTEGFKKIETAIKSTEIFKAVLAKKEKIKEQKQHGVKVDLKIDLFFQEVEDLLIKKMPSSVTPPTVGESVHFGVQWATQFGLTWLGRYLAWQYCAEYIPDSPYHVAYIACSIATAYAYSHAIVWNSRSQLTHFGSTSKKQDPCKHLKKDVIEEIREIAFIKLLFDEDLRTANSKKLDNLVELLQALNLNKTDVKVDDIFGVVTPKNSPPASPHSERKNTDAPPAGQPAQPQAEQPGQPPAGQQAQVAVDQVALILAQILRGSAQGLQPPAPPAQPLAGQPPAPPAQPPAGQPPAPPAQPPAGQPAAPPAQPPAGQPAAPPAPAPAASPPPPRVVRVKREAKAEVVPLAQKKVVPIVSAASPMKAPEELIPFFKFEFFKDQAAIERYRQRIATFADDTPAMKVIGEISRHRSIVNDNYLTKTKGSQPLLAVFAKLMGVMDELTKELQEGIDKQQEPKTPIANNNNASKRVNSSTQRALFTDSPDSKVKGAGTGTVDATIDQSSIRTTKGLDGLEEGSTSDEEI